MQNFNISLNSNCYVLCVPCDWLHNPVRGPAHNNSCSTLHHHHPSHRWGTNHLTITPRLTALVQRC